MARVFDTARNSRFLLVALVIGHLLVISRQVDAGGGTSLLEKAVFAILSPFQRAVAAAVRGAGSIWSRYVDLRGVRLENRRLEERVGRIEAELQQAREEAKEAARLRDMLNLQRMLPVQTVVAQVIARDAVPWFRTITLNRGTEDGVSLSAAVLSPSGVVGRVVAVGPKAAKVQLLLDLMSGVGVAIERSRVAGVVSGQARDLPVRGAEAAPADPGAGTPLLRMKYVPTLADVAIGDVVVTSGLDRIFPKGLVVGRVFQVGPDKELFKEILVAPSARFDTLEEVFVVRTPAATPVFTEAVRPEAVK